MEFFKDERTVIDRIHTVGKFVRECGGKGVSTYSSELHHYELIYIIEGENRVTFGDRVMYDKAGSLRLLPRGRSCGKYAVEWLKLPSACIDVFFDTESEMPPHALSAIVGEKYRGKFSELYEAWQRKEAGYYAASMKCLYDIIACLQSDVRRYAPSAQRKRTEKAYDYIVRNFNAPNFDYAALCRESGLKYSHFSTLFKSAYGMSPVKLVTKMRIDRAKELLITGRYPVSDIASMCGFSDVYYFSSAFKKQTGVSPRKYRESL